MNSNEFCKKNGEKQAGGNNRLKMLEVNKYERKYHQFFLEETKKNI